MFCSQCGSELPKGAKFCVKCGALTEDGAKQPKKVVPAVKKNELQKKITGFQVFLWKNRKTIALVILILVAALAAQELKQGSSSGGSSGGSVISILKPYEPPKVLDCLTCGGDGDCPKCNGYGTQENYAGAGDYVTSVCSRCHGSRTCPTCGGSGKR